MSQVLIDGDTGEVLSRAPEGDGLALIDTLAPEDVPEACASLIRSEMRRGKDAALEVVDSALTIGKVLLRARAVMRSDQEYGAWLRSQEFGFQPAWANTLVTAARNEAAFRSAVLDQLKAGRQANVDVAVKTITGRVSTRDRGTPNKGKGDDAEGVEGDAAERSDGAASHDDGHAEAEPDPATAEPVGAVPGQGTPAPTALDFTAAVETIRDADYSAEVDRLYEAGDQQRAGLIADALELAAKRVRAAIESQRVIRGAS